MLSITIITRSAIKEQKLQLNENEVGVNPQIPF